MDALASPILMTLLLMVALYIGARSFLTRGRIEAESEAEERMRQILAAERLGEIPEASRQELASRRRTTITDRVARWIGSSSLFQEDEGRTFLERLDEWLLQAGIRNRYTPEQALAFAMTIWALGVGLPILLKLLVGLPAFVFLPAVVFFALYPPLKLRSLITERQDAIRAEIPFFIGQLYMALSSGMATIDEAIVRVARTAEEDPYESILSREFAQAQVEYRLGGRDMETALRGISARTGVSSVENLVEALVQGLRTGTEMQRVLLEYSDTAREMWRQDMRVYKNRKQPMVTMGLVITMFGAFIIFAVPLMIQVFQTLGGLN
jgi:Flp pilus assembly protein TadB